jgi:hypothetical protein
LERHLIALSPVTFVVQYYTYHIGKLNQPHLVLANGMS